MDGFVSIQAGYQEGELITHPLKFDGKELLINYSTSAGGRILVEILDEGGNPIPGYSLNECIEIYGDEIEGVVHWKNGSDVSKLSGQVLRLRFVLKDADLYALRFR